MSQNLITAGVIDDRMSQLSDILYSKNPAIHIISDYATANPYLQTLVVRQLTGQERNIRDRLFRN